MRIRLTAATDAATFIIFDPGAIAVDAIDPDDPLNSMDVLTADGRAICYCPGTDCETDFLILLDEDPDAEFLRRRRIGVDGSLLRIPTGRLVATGYEDLCGAGKQAYSPERFKPTMGDIVDIPTGNYGVSAFEVDWEALVEQEISERAVPGDERFETIVGTSMGCVIVCTIMVLPAVLGIVWMEYGFYAALKWAGFALLFHAVFWTITIPITIYSSASGRMMRLRKEVQSRYPSTVLVLRTLQEVESQGPFNPGKFGDGFAM